MVKPAGEGEKNLSQRIFIAGSDYVLRREKRQDKIVCYINGAYKNKNIKNIFVRDKSISVKIKEILDNFSPQKYVHLPENIVSALENLLKGYFFN